MPYTIRATGTTVTVADTSAATAIPNNEGDYRARLVRVAATGPAFIKFGASTVAATDDDIFINEYSPLVLSVMGCTHFAVIHPTETSDVNVTPIEG